MPRARMMFTTRYRCAGCSQLWAPFDLLGIDHDLVARGSHGDVINGTCPECDHSVVAECVEVPCPS